MDKRTIVENQVERDSAHLFSEPINFKQPGIITFFQVYRAVNFINGQAVKRKLYYKGIIN